MIRTTDKKPKATNLCEWFACKYTPTSAEVHTTKTSMFAKL